MERLLALGAILLLAFVLRGLDADAQTLFKCVGPDNHVSFQQKPCPGAGTTIDVKPAAGQTGNTGSQTASNPPKPAIRTTPMSLEEGGKNDQLSIPPTPPPTNVDGRLDGWPRSGDGLREGMTPQEVIKVWGRPQSSDLSYRDGMWFDYCDFRIAFFFKGKLVSWSALSGESKAGTRMFRYGEPFLAATQRWGFHKERKNFLNSTERGDVRIWEDGSWVVSNADGKIVAWCRGSRAASVEPPTVKTSWE